VTSAPDRPERFQPHATREIAGMFDEVVPRYDLLNRLMTLGQDGAWRRAMWHAIPERARAVLDLCTGNGVSLEGLRRPGRLVVGIDASLGMLEQATEEHGRMGWAPRLVCADAFSLPVRSHSLDAVTVAFGVRNLRPQSDALVEIARVLKPGGTLAVLEALAPRPGFLGWFHRFHLRRVLPLLGRLSPAPDAYRYLADSIFRFGSGPEFERALIDAGFALRRRQVFMLGATALWVATAARAAGEIPTVGMETMQPARSAAAGPGDLPHDAPPAEGERRWWTAIQLLVSATLLSSLIWVLVMFYNSGNRLPLDHEARRLAALLLMAGTLFSAIRTAFLLRRLLLPPGRR
jgi:demethylmenaquinone methyltransferase / 2-methoxy-6-polyprenyl-1,4-benzoquinol methylase